MTLMTKPQTALTVRQDDSEPLEDSVKSHWSIGTQLLLTVNGICIGLVLLLHVYDYREEVQHRLGDKQNALHDEAVTTLEAIRELQLRGVLDLQEYVDRVCSRMEESRSPGHHIAVRLADYVLQAKAHHRQSPEFLGAMERAARTPDLLGRYQGRDFIVGTSQESNLSVYVSEYVDTVQQEALSDSLRRFGGSATLGLLAAVIVNVVLLKLVVRPLERLVAIVEQVGQGNFGQQADGFHSQELSFLSRAINRMSQSLADSDRSHRAQMAKARRMQQNLLPASTVVTGATVAVCYEPAEDVAGDFYDVRTLPDGSWLIFLADVTGHGIPAAMTATLLKAYLAEACERSATARGIVRHVNRRFCELTLEDDFATGVLVRYDPATRMLQVVNAGHDSGLYRPRQGHNHACESTGLLLGFDETADWSVETITTANRDRLLIFTDGVTETSNADGVLFGRQRVLALLNETADRPPSEALDAMTRELATFRGDGPQLDDVTIIVIDF